MKNKPFPKPFSVAGVELEYYTLIHDHLNVLEKLIYEQLGLKNDDWNDSIKSLFDTMKQLFGEIRVYKLIELFNRIAFISRSSIKNQFESVLGINPFYNDVGLQEKAKLFIDQNVLLISNLTNNTIDNIETLLFEQIPRGQSYRDLQDKIKQIFTTSDSRAELIARDQTTKLYAKINISRYKEVGLTSYYWRTAKDERVRKDHNGLDGQLFSFDNPPITCTEGKRSGERNNPGEDIQCRCWPEPILPEVQKYNIKQDTMEVYLQSGKWYVGSVYDAGTPLGDEFLENRQCWIKQIKNNLLLLVNLKVRRFITFEQFQKHVNNVSLYPDQEVINKLWNSFTPKEDTSLFPQHYKLCPIDITEEVPNRVSEDEWWAVWVLEKHNDHVVIRIKVQKSWKEKVELLNDIQMANVTLEHEYQEAFSSIDWATNRYPRANIDELIEIIYSVEGIMHLEVVNKVEKFRTEKEYDEYLDLYQKKLNSPEISINAN